MTIIIKSAPLGYRAGPPIYESVICKMLFNKLHPHWPCCSRQVHILFRLLHEGSKTWSGEETEPNLKDGNRESKQSGPAQVSAF